MKLAFCAALGAIVMVLGVGCGGSDDCIILANGGNKLCGDDAAAWCNSTDALRDVAGEISANPHRSEGLYAPTIDAVAGRLRVQRAHGLHADGNGDTTTALSFADDVFVMVVSGSGMKAEIEPSRALPMRIPRFHALRVGSTVPDSESAT